MSQENNKQSILEYKGIKTINQIMRMNINTLRNIALNSLSLLVSEIEPNQYVKEYDRVKSSEELHNKEFIIKAPVYVLIDKNKNLRLPFIFHDDDLKKLKELATSNPNKIITISTVKIPMSFFKTPKELEEATNPLTNVPQLYTDPEAKRPKGFVKSYEHLTRSPDAPVPEIEIKVNCKAKWGSPLVSPADVNPGIYDTFCLQNKMQKINGLSFLLPEVLKKQRLLIDENYLKMYILELLLGKEYLESFVSSNKDTLKLTDEQNNINEDVLIEELRNKAIAKSLESTQNLLSSTQKLRQYKDYLEGLKKENQAQMKHTKPKLWLKAQNLTEDQLKFLHESGNLHQMFKYQSTYYFLVIDLEFITEDDLQNLEQGQLITKTINGINFEFELDYDRQGIIYYNPQNSPENSNKALKNAIDKYRNEIIEYYPERRKIIQFCDRQLSILKSLEETLELAKPAGRKH